MEEDRRKFRFINHIAEIFVGRQSRKVAFGVWLFWISNLFLKLALITPEIWWKCVMLSGALIGFGTILDSVLQKVGDRMATVVADKAKLVVNQTNVTVNTDPPQS